MADLTAEQCQCPKRSIELMTLGMEGQNLLLVVHKFNNKAATLQT
jgi:hypothetical protein